MPTITPQIVTLNTQVQTAPSVSQLQQSGAIISTGGTTLVAGASLYCGNLAAVTAILSAPLAITSLAWLAGVVTATVSADLELAVGQTFTTTIAGATPAAYNGTFVATVATTTTFTYSLATNPGTETVAGTYTPNNAAFVNNAAMTFFAQGNTLGVYVLELGPVTSASNAITALQSWITTNSSPQQFYAYLIPPSWDVNSAATLNTVTKNYANPTGTTYFFVTTTLANISLYAANKAVFALVPSPTKASTEEQAAQLFYQWLVNNPGPGNVLAPMAYRYGYGVTPWLQQGNASSIQSVLSAFGNLILTGAQGGISTATLFKGTTMDGAQAAFWYGVDYFQIQVAQALSAVVIEGSNTQPPLLYNQAGVNTLQATAEQIASDAVAYGCAESVTITAVPFATYIAEFPANYGNGIYDGLSATLTGQSGFLSVTFNLTAVAFPT